MALTQLDKMKILGILKGKVEFFGDLSFETRSKYTMDELLAVIVELLFKNMNHPVNDSFIFNALSAIESILVEFISCEHTLTDKMTDQLRQIEIKYNEYLENNKEDEKVNDNEAIRKLIKIIKEDIIFCNTPYNKNGTVGEIVQEDTSSLDKMTETQVVDESMDEYKRQIKELEKKVNSLTKKLDKKTTEEQKRNEQIHNLRSELKELTKQTKRIQVLETEKQEQETIIQSLQYQNKLATTSVDQKTTKIQVLEEKLKLYYEEDKKSKELEELEYKILEILILGEKTIEKLEKLLSVKGNKVSIKNIKKAIISLSEKFNIQTHRMRNFSPLYSVSTINAEINKKISIFGEYKVIDLLVISDLHLGHVDKNDIENFDKMYNYCASNGIDLIVNLGDLFSYDYLADSTIMDKMDYNKRIISKAIKKIPFDKNIHHAILGGNHDRKILRWGMDAIKELENARTDITSLGYDHACINIREDNLLLHHMVTKISEYEPIDQGFLQLRSSYYGDSPYLKEDTYIDLYGHFHRSLLDSNEGFAFCPSLTCDRVENGAWHLKIHLNDLGNIENIIFIPLVNKYRLIQNDEIVYKKLTRK